MKSAESKTTATAQSLQAKPEQQQQPFFQQERTGEASAANDTAFFSPNGNGAIQRKPFFSKPLVQPKLKIGQPGDKYEQEADHMADQVVQRLAESDRSAETEQESGIRSSKPLSIQRKPIFESEADPNVQTKLLPTTPASTSPNISPHPTTIQPKCETCEQKSAFAEASADEQLQKMDEPGEEEQLQMKPIFESTAPPPDDDAVQRTCAECAAEEETVQTQTEGAPAPASSPSLESSLQSSKGGGSPLPEDTRSQMEGAFGSDFSGVRVHTDSSAVQMNKDLGAQAFTHGSDVYFNAGKYDTGSTGGKSLLAHELTHVVQQNGSAVRPKVQAHQEHDLQKQEAENASEEAVQKSESKTTNVIESSAAGETSMQGRANSGNIGKEPMEEFQSEEAEEETLQKMDAPVQAGAPANPEPPNENGNPASLQLSPSHFIQEKCAECEAEVESNVIQKEEDGDISAELAEELKRSEEEQKAAISDSEANQTRNQADNEAQEAELSAQEEVPEAMPEASPPLPESAQEASETRTAEPTPQNADRAPDPLATPEEPLGPAGQQLATESENACQDAADKSQELADNEQAHDDATEKVEQSEGAVEHPTEESQSQSNAEQVGTMEETPGPEADPEAAKAELDKSIEEAVPQSIDEMNKFESGKKGQVVGNKVLAVSASQVGEVKGTYSEIENTPPPAEAEQPVPLPEIEEAPPTPALDLGEGAVPDVAPEQTDFSEYENQADEIYEKEGVTPELKAETEKVTDGEIGEANKERQNLNEKVAGEPDKIQEFAKERQQNVETDLRKEEEQARADMEAKRAAELDGAQKEQQKTKSAMELKREEVTNWINTRYEAAKTYVDETLKNLEQQSLAQFDAGQKALSTQFERNVKRRVNAWKADRYSGLFGGVKWLKDKFFGIDDFPEIKEIFSSERENFVQGIDQLIAEISQSNNETIQACKDEITKANQEIEEYVSQLEPGLQDIGKKAQEETAQKLKALDDKVEEEKKKLQDALCKKREEAIKAIDEKIEAMKEEMSGLLSKLGNLLLGLAKKFFKWAIEKIGGSGDRIIAILDKGAAVLKALFTDPIGFFINLGKAVGGGIDRFVSNIVTHLKKGLITWLTGAMGDSGLQLPETFDMKGILSIGLQVMGLTWNIIRSKIVKSLGPKGEAIMSKAESAVEVIKRVKEEGPIALWHILKEKAGEFKEKVLEGIRSWAITQIIKKATVKLISMLNPVGAIIQAIIAIYDVVMFFVENWQRIVDFVTAIFDSISEIAKGAIGKAAGFIEKTLGLAVPLIITFLSRFIGLSGIGKAIKKIIETIRKPIEKVMGKVVGFVVKMVKKVFGKGKKGKKAVAEAKGDPQKAQKIQTGLADIDKEEKKYLDAGKITREEAEKVAKTVKGRHPVFKSIKVVDGGKTWNYKYKASPDQIKEGEPQAENKDGENRLRETKYIKNGQLKLKYQKAKMIRVRLYGANKGYPEAVHQTAKKLIDQYTDPEDPANWITPIYSESIPKKEYTIEHSEPTVKNHWNSTGFNTKHQDRLNFFKFNGRLGEIRVLSKKENEDLGRKEKGNPPYRFDIGNGFTGPDES